MNIRLSRDDIQQFANWSGDCNPIHVNAEHARQTHFGRSIAHGMLTAIHSLAASRHAGGIRQIEMEFRGAVYPDEVYQPSRDEQGSSIALSGESGVVLQMDLGEEGEQVDAEKVDSDWTARVVANGQEEIRTKPCAWNVEQFVPGMEVSGIYRTELVP